VSQTAWGIRSTGYSEPVKKTWITCAIMMLLFSNARTAIAQEEAYAEAGAPFKTLCYFGGFNLEYAPITDKLATNLGVHAGLLYKKRLEISVYGLYMVDKYQRRVVFPEGFQIFLYHAGFQTSYYLRPAKKIRPMASVRFGMGMVGWKPLEDSEETFRDRIYPIRPSMGIQYELTSWMIIQASIGYMRVIDLNMIGLNEDDLEGMDLSFGLKVGKFD